MNKRIVATALPWLPIAAWTFVYVPLAVQSLLNEGAVGYGLEAILALLLFAVTLLGPMVLMCLLRIPRRRGFQSSRVFHTLAITVLCLLLGILLYEILPAPWANRDLFLPFLALAAFLALHYLVPIGR